MIAEQPNHWFLPVLFIDKRTGRIEEPVPSKAAGWYPSLGGRGFTSNPHFAERQPASSSPSVQVGLGAGAER